MENHEALNMFSYKVMDNESRNFNDRENVTTRSLFSFSNENLEAIFENRDLTDKKVATVGSSGDQVLYAILNGSKDITLIDANALSQPYVELKMAAIKNLEFEEFLDYFTFANILSGKYYSKISHDLSEYAKTFWDNILLDLDSDAGEKGAKIFLFQLVGKGADFAQNREALSFCRDKQIYNQLKEKMNGCKVTFKVSTLEDFNKDLDDKYDLILLSNIYDYVNSKKFFECTKKLRKKHMARKGEMQLYYNFTGFSLDDFIDEWRNYNKFKWLKIEKVKDIRNYSVFKDIIDEGLGNSCHVIFS